MRFIAEPLIMKKIILLLCILGSLYARSQFDSLSWARSFPITGYMLSLTDSIKLVQVQLPPSVVIKEGQMGIVKGIYRGDYADTNMLGGGRCQLIKGDYYYFAIRVPESRASPREGDLLYMILNGAAVFRGMITQLACYYIGLQDVYETPFYDRFGVFEKWTQQDEEALIGKLLEDVAFTGKYFLENNPAMNAKIESGRFAGQMVLNAMINSERSDITGFLEYMILRPKLYAGKEWKFSEIFATWLAAGTPGLVKNN